MQLPYPSSEIVLPILAMTNIASSASSISAVVET
jgi:hypothetical protein